MGVYTTIKVGDREGQVKLWNDHDNMIMAGVTVRSAVPDIGMSSAYAISMREGGFVMIYDSKIISWLDDLPEDYPYRVFDKWGDSWLSNEQNLGLLEEPYNKS